MTQSRLKFMRKEMMQLFSLWLQPLADTETPTNRDTIERR